MADWKEKTSLMIQKLGIMVRCENCSTEEVVVPNKFTFGREEGEVVYINGKMRCAGCKKPIHFSVPFRKVKDVNNNITADTMLVTREDNAVFDEIDKLPEITDVKNNMIERKIVQQPRQQGQQMQPVPVQQVQPVVQLEAVQQVQPAPVQQPQPVQMVNENQEVDIIDMFNNFIQKVLERNTCTVCKNKGLNSPAIMQTGKEINGIITWVVISTCKNCNTIIKIYGSVRKEQLK